MRNVYQRFVMRPATTQAMADRLRGAPGRVTGIAPNIRRSNAPEVFFKNALFARSTVQAQSGVYPLGAQGGLAGFGFGAFNTQLEVLPGVGFVEQWAWDDWSQPREWMTRAGYEGRLDDTVMNRAVEKYGALKAAADMGDMAAEQQLKAYLNSVSLACDALDRHTKTRGTYGYGEAGDKERARLANNVNAAIRKLANATIAAPNPGGGGGGYAPPGGGGSTFRPPMGSSTGAATSDSGPSMGMIALGAAVVLGAGVWLIKRKKS